MRSTSVLCILVGVIVTALLCHPSLSSRLVHSIPLSYGVDDTVYCVDKLKTTLLVFYDRLVSIHADDASVAFNETWGDLGWARKPSFLGLVDQIIIVQDSDSDELCGMFAVNGTTAWRSGMFLIGMHPTAFVMGGHVFIADNSASYSRLKWIAAVDALSGAVMGNVTTLNDCDGATSVMLARFPFVLVQRNDYDNDLLYSVMLQFPPIASSTPSSSSATVPIIRWRQVDNLTLVKFYDSWMQGPCVSGEGVGDDDEDCLLVRWGQGRRNNETRVLNFIESISARTGKQVGSLNRVSSSSPSIPGCAADLYTHRSNTVNDVNGTFKGRSFHAGAFALRCYTSNPEPTLLTWLVNASNVTQLWNGVTRVPITWDGNKIVLSPEVTWSLVNNGNNVIGRQSITIDAYMTATGARPASFSTGGSEESESTTTTSWPLVLPDMVQEYAHTCAARNFLVMQTKNASSWEPYERVLYIVVV